ncbi:serine hydrolase domain-containing protein [Nonomuraea pusilla]|uniref:D-alanyl-D-alanine carboxypeptidase n=1 Tax=Nonomuraea pusilla TaxID=46177 RepID=A0A1H8GXM8_9ACTN|nr:serine hydrolase domain-containing protein [Nonomuraea pusilla]SEN48615.1 D-alanyl-D-alanine carboxypeptidase [Nonomuraea pusilla]
MRTYVAGAAAVAVVLTAVSPAAAAVASPTAGVASPSAVQQQVDRLTRQDGLAGAVVSVRERDGRSTTWTSGTAERGTGKPMVGADGRIRAASVTKTVIGLTVTRLSEQGRLDLDAQVEHYLPGLLHGRHVTVRQLLRHTSGLPEYFDLVDWAKPADPAAHLALAMGREPVGEPGERWFYSNTNYLILGMLIEKVTGRDFRQVTQDGVLKGLRATYWPENGELDLRGPHAHTYGLDPTDPSAGETDMTRLPGYAFGAGGGLVSTPADLNRFWQSIRPSTLKSMVAGAVPADDPKGSRYGLGLYTYPLSCGQVIMHDGGLPGIRVLSGRDRSGRAATVYVTGTPKDDRHLFATLDAALCRPSA